MDRVTHGVTVVGAGGIGCALGHALRAGGLDLMMVEADAEKLAWGREHGLGVDDEPCQSARFIAFDDWQPSTQDLILLCTKCYDNRAVLERLPETATVIPVQNGFDADLVDRVAVEGIASFVTECLSGRTHTRITRPGDLHIGFSSASNDRSVPSPVDSMISALERHGKFTVRRVTEVLPYKNTKLMYNAAISPIAAVAGIDNGRLLTLGTARKLFFGLLRENYRILKGAAEPLATIGPFHPDTVNRLLHIPLLARLLAIPFSRSLRGTYCSMAGDLPHGPTELDNYNGYLLALAGDADVPLNREVYRLARRVEENGSDPGLRWLDELLESIAASERGRIA